jgi:hypothetical protein
MLKVNITEEVKKKRDHSSKEADGIVEAAQLLLEGDHQKEREILKDIGLGHQIQEAEKQSAVNLERKTFENEYGGETVMQESEIKDLCLKYDLRFLNTKHYKGSVDLGIGPKVKRFVESNNISASASDFFLLGPGKAFNLKEREIRGRSKFAVDLDPVLFYRVPDNSQETMYVMVHKWGNDFTIFRYLRGLVLENSSSYIFSQLTIGFAISLVLCNLLDGDHTIGWGNIILSIVLGAAYTLTMMLIRCRRLSEGDSWDEAFNGELWNSTNQR